MLTTTSLWMMVIGVIPVELGLVLYTRNPSFIIYNHPSKRTRPMLAKAVMPPDGHPFNLEQSELSGVPRSLFFDIVNGL